MHILPVDIAPVVKQHYGRILESVAYHKILARIVAYKHKLCLVEQANLVKAFHYLGKRGSIYLLLAHLLGLTGESRQTSQDYGRAIVVRS